jgi:CheY-like chemotaxis protein
MPQRIVGLMANQPPVRVLVADDDPDNRELMTRLLESASFQVQAVENGQQAITAFEAWRPHFIWMDMQMPVMNGYEATRYIRSLAYGDKVKIAAQTASVFKEEREAILTAGCDEIIPKPISEQQLFQVMGKLLNLRYCYEDSSGLQAEETGNAASDLQLLPQDLQAELKNAAEQLDLEAIRTITDKMQDYPLQAKTINQWVNDFRFDMLLAVLKK